ncbi:MAG: uracil-DNA glycosylase [Parvularculaceae bacterium]|nr:uracil-DNA glycosylase [Parvularculaceae bacterium]
MDPQARDILQFYAEAGVETVESDSAGGLWNWQTQAPPPSAAPIQASRPAEGHTPLPMASAAASTDEALAHAEHTSASATNLEALVELIRGFEGCPLKDGARGPVVFDGILGADILVMGEAPGREEDRMGKPFVGRSGQLLDRMLAAIGLSRAPQDDQKAACISNVVYWRPPGNRNPTKAELAVCLPFARRFIELSQPKLVLTAGKVPTEALFPDVSSIIRARGQWRQLDLSGGQSVPVLPIFHPAFLLRQPAQKRWAWHDLLAAKAKLNESLS